MSARSRRPECAEPGAGGGHHVKAVFHERGIGRVQTIARPLGAPTPAQVDPVSDRDAEFGHVTDGQVQQRQHGADLQQADELGHTIAIMAHM